MNISVEKQENRKLSTHSKILGNGKEPIDMIGQQENLMAWKNLQWLITHMNYLEMKFKNRVW